MDDDFDTEAVDEVTLRSVLRQGVVVFVLGVVVSVALLTMLLILGGLLGFVVIPLVPFGHDRFLRQVLTGCAVLIATGIVIATWLRRSGRWAAR